MSIEDLVHYLKLGGPTLWLILAASLIALAVAFERLVALWGFSARSRDLGENITRQLLRGDTVAARAAAERSDSMIADLFRAGFSRTDQVGPDRHALVASAVDRERAQLGLRLKRNLWLLGTIGATAPFVGLLGTVVGIMKSFRDLGLDVEAGGTGGSAAVMTGISEALIVTAVGILVAVEAVILYNYFQARISRIQVEVRLMAEEFVELLRSPAPATPLELPPASAKAEG
ncbi:MAG: MotA/TolQ/ExbB proton channel family protein [Myxococcota bacterium]|nr:MotA/TolQ/ExbB proton channel family protein [Myxococcota bacterium]